MNQQMKNRIIGGIVLGAVAAIFIPVLFHRAERESLRSTPLSENIPKVPQLPHVSLQLPTQTNVVQEQTEQNVKPAADEVKPEASDNSTKPVSSPNVISNPNVQTQQQPAVEQMPASTTIIQAATEEKAKPVPSGVSKQVEEKSKPMVTNAVLWSVQLASFTNMNNADRLVKRLQKEGYHAYLRKEIMPKGQVITRVFVGPANQRDALQLQQKIQQTLHLKGVIRHYQNQA